MADLRVLALDLSLNSTGAAHADGTLATIKPPAKLRGMARLSWILGYVTDAYIIHNVDVVVLEGYSYASKQGAHQLGELGGVVRLHLWDEEVPYVDVPPSSLKRYATGRGNASKDEMLVAAVKRLGVEPTDNNQADASWLRAAALDHYGQPPVVMPASHREALEAVKWPELVGWAL